MITEQLQHLSSISCYLACFAVLSITQGNLLSNILSNLLSTTQQQQQQQQRQLPSQIRGARRMQLYESKPST
jgi:hypothetical protein